ncbi:MAG TPA: hypothetical protein VHZ02_02065 [Acidimicrobiales bacterium]|nr:hypothetical protein [Acidimicrobiales bacterium]
MDHEAIFAPEAGLCRVTPPPASTLRTGPGAPPVALLRRAAAQWAGILVTWTGILVT